MLGGSAKLFSICGCNSIKMMLIIVRFIVFLHAYMCACILCMV